MAMGGHHYQWSYFQYVDLLDSYSYSVVFQSAKSLPLPPYFNMFKPFTLLVWLLIVGTLFLTMGFFPVLSYLAKHHGNEYVRDAMDVYGHQFSQGINERNKTSVNVFMMAWYWYTFFVHAIYDCNLRAYLMAVDRTPEANNVKDIWDQV